MHTTTYVPIIFLYSLFTDHEHAWMSFSRYHVGMVEMIACLVWCTALGQQPDNVSPILEEHSCSRHGDCYSCVSDSCSRTDDNSPFACVWCANGAAADEGACIPSSSSRECDVDKLSVSVKDCLDHGSRLAATWMGEPTPQHLQGQVSIARALSLPSLGCFLHVMGGECRRRGDTWRLLSSYSQTPLIMYRGSWVSTCSTSTLTHLY